MIFLTGLALFIASLYVEQWYPDSRIVRGAGTVGLLCMVLSVILLLGSVMP